MLQRGDGHSRPIFVIAQYTLMENHIEIIRESNTYTVFYLLKNNLSIFVQLYSNYFLPEKEKKLQK